MDLRVGLIADRSFRVRSHLDTFLRGVTPEALLWCLRSFGEALSIGFDSVRYQSKAPNQDGVRLSGQRTLARPHQGANPGELGWADRPRW